MTVSAVATYNNANVGTGKTITVAYMLSGKDASKYKAPATTVMENGVIQAAPLTISTSAVVNNKVYDGTNTATVETQPVVTGVIDSDVVSIDTTATFADVSAGGGKTVNLTYTLSGTDANNYSLASSTTTANITAKQLTVSAPTVSKVYDGTTTATIIPGIITGIVESDEVALSATGTYDDANVGSTKVVSNITYKAVGSKAGNYIAPPASSITNGVITAAPITAIENITGTATGSQVLTAGASTPTNATVTYQWQHENSTEWTNIPGATSRTYRLQMSDLGKKVRVQVTGTGNYSGTISSAPTVAITPQ
ncbi:hemagglutination protein [Sporosarcina sp. PTS2304]|nr:hemagglutination protein [Sporosarcina sp. PTS2304]